MSASVDFKPIRSYQFYAILLFFLVPCRCFSILLQQNPFFYIVSFFLLNIFNQICNRVECEI